MTKLVNEVIEGVNITLVPGVTLRLKNPVKSYASIVGKPCKVSDVLS